MVLKIKFFLWKALHEIILTKINLVDRFVDVDPFCLRCGVDVESTEHVFRDCVFAKKVWELSSVGFSFNHLSLEKWICKGMTELDNESFCMFATTLWVLWFARNVMVFQNTVLSEQDVVHRALAHRRDFFYSKSFAASAGWWSYDRQMEAPSS